VAGVNTLINSDLFTLTSSAFAPNGQIPVDYTCEGAGSSPPFTWANVPSGTVEVVLVITDPDAAGFIHWMVAGIDPNATDILAGTVPAGATQLVSSGGTPAYAPICPPAGPSHTYEFTLYALSAPSGLTAASDTRAASAQVAAEATAIAVLTGSYASTTAN
jgi:Raf kinase inhibitor-like YbhB/YbcL family protein